MTKENKIIKDLKERNDKLNNQYRSRDIRCVALEERVNSLTKENKQLKEAIEVKSYCKYANKCNEIYDCTKEEYNNMVLSNCELGVKLDCSLEMLAEWGPPCELDGFMDKHSDYCEKNCSVDEVVFKKCWLMYIEDKLEDEVE